ncbi:ABC transporter ATP-binding protein [Anaerococcus hydrogenalis]|uniref:ABC transporter n=1 Tax=Anaerococcus hydrogenalis TaxID=33029 RepID=A0A2N6UHQ2_9FIRM|nr:ATP-binding cassette domain-containing protein [Anaerococcus hydrogenalis]MDK7695409.1 ATP-binding cassette domain-containing protein [Anaerococcus hydrogenalis]MDK7697168.1 ATP-binding cassette domain-containing protein [Anaerococcus hydrogenalis]MDK7708311.1 ATP-binding cassette domain-containing protein [Anaerococcus hydrogenalis]PMC81138.1 ABC transporter [Anaerococcus hydrogenalis]
MLKVERLKKSFGDLDALKKIDFEVKDGELFGVIGQNGAGKSTLFRCIMNFYSKYEGSITYNGKNFSKVPLEKIGFLPEERSLDPKRKVEDQIRYFAKLNKMKNISDQKLKEWFDYFEIDGKLSSKIKELSKGNQQKVQLLCALIYKPEFVILDEPFSGLDPYNIRLLEKIIKDVNKEGTTIMFSSHNMENVESLCQKLIMLKKGNIVLNGSPQEIRNSYERKKLVVESSEDLFFLNDENIEMISQDGGKWTFILKDEDYAKVIFKKIVDNIGFVPYFDQSPPTLNEIFARKVEENE